MSLPVSYKLFFDDAPASRADLDRFEEITVEQEVDMAWEARLQLPLCVDAQGQWTGDDARFARAFSRIRIEVQVGRGAFVPLIDGPVVAQDSQRRTEPGQSLLTLVVHDDSAYLNREESLERYDNLSDHEIAERIFRDGDAYHDLGGRLSATAGRAAAGGRAARHPDAAVTDARRPPTPACLRAAGGACGPECRLL